MSESENTGGAAATANDSRSSFPSGGKDGKPGDAAGDAVPRYADSEPPSDGGKPAEVAGGSEPDWRDAIEDEQLRKQLDRYTSVEDMLRHNLALRRRLSRAVPLPEANAAPEDIAAFRSRIGVPESPDGYVYEAPEDLPDEVAGIVDDEEMAEIREVAHGLGLTQEQLSGLLDWRFDRLSDFGGRVAADLARARTEAETALRREWGRDYERNLNLSRRALREFGGEGLLGFLSRARADGAQLANHPEIVKWAANAGRALAEASLRHGGEGGGLSAEERRSELTRAIHDARAAGDTARARELDAERRALTARTFGDRE